MSVILTDTKTTKIKLIHTKRAPFAFTFTDTHTRTPEHTHTKMKTQESLFGILLKPHSNLQVRGHINRLVHYRQKEAFQTQMVIPKGGHGRKRLAREDATDGRPI